MERVAANAGAVRRERLHGREYLVAPFVSIVADSVLHGSQGALYYPAEEVGRDPSAWDGVPIVVSHPVENGTHRSARDPDVIGRSGVGTVYRSSYDGRLRGEAWIDVEALRQVDAGLLDAVTAGRPVELSTGLHLDAVPAEGRAPDGRPYTHVARNYRPDHLALLTAEKGACPLERGCGLNVNAADVPIVVSHPVEAIDARRQMLAAYVRQQPTLFDSSEGGMNRQATVKYLAANCACWKGEQGKKALDALTDEQLDALKAQAVGAAVLNALRKKQIAVNAGRLVVNAEGEAAPGVPIAELAEFLGVTEDPANDPGGFTRAILAKLDEIRAKLAGEEPPPKEEEEKPAEAPMQPATNRAKTAAEWLAEAPPEIRSAVRNAQAIEARERAALIELVTNAVPAAMRDAMRPVYEGMATPDLQRLAASVPQEALAQAQPAPVMPSYAGSAPVFNRGAKDDSANVLPTFEIDWSAHASPALRKK